MKTITNTSQTKILQELGWPNPKENCYTLAELMSFVNDSVYIWVITKNSPKVQLIYFFDKQGEGGSLTKTELIDALYETCVNIKTYVLSKNNKSQEFPIVC